MLDRLADPAYSPSDDPLLDIEKRAFVAGVATAAIRHIKQANPVGRVVGGALKMFGKGVGGVFDFASGVEGAARGIGGLASPLVRRAAKGAAGAVGSGLSSAMHQVVQNPLMFAFGVPSVMHSVGKYTSSPYAPQQTVSGLSRSRTGA